MLALAVFPAAQLSQPPSRSGWLADDVIFGVSFTSLSVKKTKKTSHQGQLQANAKIMVVVKKQVTHSVTSQSMKALKTLVLTEVKEA